MIKKTYLTTYFNDNPNGARSISKDVTGKNEAELADALAYFKTCIGTAKVFKIEETITEITDGGGQ